MRRIYLHLSTRIYFRKCERFGNIAFQYRSQGWFPRNLGITKLSTFLGHARPPPFHEGCTAPKYLTNERALLADLPALQRRRGATDEVNLRLHCLERKTWLRALCHPSFRRKSERRTRVTSWQTTTRPTKSCLAWECTSGIGQGLRACKGSWCLHPSRFLEFDRSSRYAD